MKAGVLFFILADIKDYLIVNKMLDNDGTCHFEDLSDDIGLASVVTRSLEQHGVDVPDKVEKILSSLPLFLSIFG